MENIEQELNQMNRIRMANFEIIMACLFCFAVGFISSYMLFNWTL